jgi:methyl-accepting chemotaxis protein
MTPLKNNSDSPVLYGSLTVMPVILGTVVAFWHSGVNVYSVLLSVLLIFCSIGSGLFLWRRHLTELAQTNARWELDESSKINAIATYTTELERLLLTISPILSQQVMFSREHTEQEIISLANRFAAMVNELQQIVDSTDNTLDGQHFHLDSVINKSHDLLQPVLESLTRIYHVEHQAKAELQKLSHHLGGLHAIATEVHELTGKIDNRHQLMDIELRLNTKVNAMITVVNKALILPWFDQGFLGETAGDDLTLSQAEDHINQTLAYLGLALNHYREDVDALRNNAEQIRAEINNVLVALQFQDRVSQILTQVENNLLNLQKTIETVQRQGSNRDGAMLQVDAAVEHIEENYKSVNSKPEREPDGLDDLTFF